MKFPCFPLRNRLVYKTARSIVRVVFTAAIFGAVHLPAQSSFTAAEAKNHIGENTTVCGQVASTRYASRSRGRPTFLNLEKPYPEQIFTALIWGSDRPKFGQPEVTYSDRHICVTGTISEYRGVPEIVIHDSSQLRLSK